MEVSHEPMKQQHIEVTALLFYNKRSLLQVFTTFCIHSGWGRNLWRGVQGHAPARVEHRAWRVVGTQESETRKREGRFSYHRRQRNQDSQTVETQEHHQTERNCH